MDSRVNVWIIGSSIISRLRSHLLSQRWDLHIHPECAVSWFGRGGRRWEELLPLLRRQRAESHYQPDVIIIHVGGNSIGVRGQGRRKLMVNMKADIREIAALFPGTVLMFSDILPRRCWRYQSASSGYGMERARRWLNAVMMGFMSDLGMKCIMHGNITLNHLASDGVHLNAEGNNLLLSNIRSALAALM